MTTSEIIARTRVLLGDQEDMNFTDAEIVQEVNAALLELNDALSFYVRSESLPLVDGRVNYELPSDAMTLQRVRWDDAEGQEVHLKAEGDLERAGPTEIMMDDSFNSFSLTKPITGENIDQLGVGGQGNAYPYWGS